MDSENEAKADVKMENGELAEVEKVIKRKGESTAAMEKSGRQ